MDVDFIEYRISSELTGHEDDVRSLFLDPNCTVAVDDRRSFDVEFIDLLCFFLGTRNMCMW